MPNSLLPAVCRLQNNNGIFRENKVLTDAQGNVVLTAKKFPLSLAKWTICSPSGTVLAKTRTISGMAKYAVEVDVPSARIKPTFTVSPDLSNSQVLMWQNNGKGKEDTTMCTATYGANVALGLVSAAVQDWTYHIVVEPGAGGAGREEPVWGWRSLRASLCMCMSHCAPSKPQKENVPADAALACCFLIIFTGAWRLPGCLHA